MSSPQSGWRRAITGIGLAALVFGILATPATAAPSTAESGVVAPLATITVPARVIGKWLPPHTRGDREYDGHGPRVTASASLVGAFRGSRSLTVRFCMTAVETKRDFTTASGCEDQATIFNAPAGECISSVNIGTFGSISYTDTDHSDDVFPNQLNNFVGTWIFVGDTSGDDVGVDTGMTVVTRDIPVTTIPC